MTWLEKGTDLFDLVFVDFPDPNSFAVGKLYTTRFYGLLKRRLSPDGAFAVQSTSPLFARKSFWIIDRTIEASGFATRAVPRRRPVLRRVGLRPRVAPALRRPGAADPRPPLPLRRDAPRPLLLRSRHGPVEAPVNRLHDQVLVRTYESEWRKFE